MQKSTTIPEPSGMQSAGAILRRSPSEFVVSKQKIQKALVIELIRWKREQRNQTLCFGSRPFVLCGLPIRSLPKNQLLYERRNGKFVLQITGHPDYGDPLGQARI